MIEPASLDDFFTIFFASAMVILFGALYALLFAFSRVCRSSRLMPLAYGAYLGLFACTLMLAHAANLLGHPVWTVIVVLMLSGYLFAPHAVWHLCVGTHADEQEVPGKGK